LAEIDLEFARHTRHRPDSLLPERTFSPIDRSPAGSAGLVAVPKSSGTYPTWSLDCYFLVRRLRYRNRKDSRTPLAMQVGSAMGAVAVGRAGVGGTIAAGTAVVTAKVVAVTVLATAAPPFVIGAAAIGAIGWGLYKAFGDSDR
jgi:hypothetical protein